MKSYTPTPVYKENKAEALRSDIIYYIVSCFFLYIIGQIIDVIFAPLKMLSKEEAEKQLAEEIREKIDARENRVFDDPNDPMNQFRLRFIEKKPEYKKDKENNELYYEWFQAWRNGEVIDSDLRWAPTAMDYDDTMHKNFVQYMKIQYTLHKKAGLFRRMLFLNTIHKYYPELSANMKGLENDLANYEEERDIVEAEETLREEFRKLGLSAIAQDYLIEKDINAKELQEEVQFIKRNMDKGFSEEACLFHIKYKIRDEYFELTEKGLKKNIPEKLIAALFRNEISEEDFTVIAEDLKDDVDLFGPEFMYEVLPWSGQTRYEDNLDKELEKYKTKNITRKLNK